MIREPDTVVVRPVPYLEPVEWTWARGVYASWITEEMITEVEDG